MISIDLIERAQNGDDEAFLQIYEKYKRIISIKMGRYYLYGAEREDLFQEGAIGLFKALKAYDFKKEASFETFASLCINRNIITAVVRSSNTKNRALRMAKDIYEDGKTKPLTISKYNDPESIYLGKEKLHHLKNKLKNNLSRMEEEVYEYMVLGFTYKEISKKTGRSTKTIDNTIQRVRKKIQYFSEY